MVKEMNTRKAEFIKKTAVFHMLPSGGGIRVLRQFVNGFSSDIEPHIYQPDGAGKATDSASIKENTYPYPMWKKAKGGLKPIAPLFLILRLLSFKKLCKIIAHDINSFADIALVHNTMPIAAPPILQYLTIPSIYFCYEHPRHIYEKDIIRRTTSPLAEIALLPLTKFEKAIDYNSAVSASKVLTFSTYMQDNIRNIYGRSAEIVRPGVDSSFFCPAERKNQRANFVLSVGALWPFKGHETAIKILHNLPEANRPVLTIIADREFPGYTQKLTDLASSLSIDIQILQGIKDTDLRKLYREAKAVLCCQRREPYGLVPLEAMACNTPVIALNEGGFKDNIVHDETGLLFNNSPNEAAELLLSLLESPSLSNRLTSNGLTFVREKRSLKSSISKLEEMLHSL